MRFKLRALLFVLAGMMLAACGREPTHPRDGRDIDNLEIFRPALSPDGRYMVFDFVEYTSVPGQSPGRSRIHLALYDIEAQTVELIAPRNPLLTFNSASFAADDQVLVLIQHCWSDECPPEDLGHQVGMLELKERRYRRVTDGRKPSYLWNVTYTDDLPERLQRVIIRTHPIFVPSEFAVYYMGFHRPQIGSSPAVGEHYSIVRRQLMRVDLATGNESLAMDPKLSAVAFKKYGRVALSGEHEILISGDPIGLFKDREEVKNLEAHVFYFDLKSKRLSPVFAAPPYFNNNSGRPEQRRFTFRPLSLTSSADGRRMAFVDYSDRTGRLSVWLTENGQTREPLDLTPYGIDRVAFVALSANGEHLAILDDKSNQRFLIYSLANGQVRELPLRAPLRKAIRNAGD